MMQLLFGMLFFCCSMSELSQQYFNEDIRTKYGDSFWQNNIINVIKLHEAGVTGERILIGVVDTGFDRSHEALKNAKVTAEYDFINNDNNTADENNSEAGNEMHGTSVWSVVSGFKPGKLIGTSYGSDFALAKTEIAVPGNPELEIEEEYFEKALTWLEEIGADIVTSSLVFHRLKDGGGYTKEDMDGNTVRATIAADKLFSKGIFFLNGVGNGFQTNWPTVLAPSDGFNVFSIGAVDSNGVIARFSSTGPTEDGRLKPDVLGPGVQLTTVNGQSTTGYRKVGGTSLATPAIAGVAALILSAHPNLGPEDIAEAMRNTAGSSTNPRNRFGYGLVDAYSAASYFGPVFSNTPIVGFNDNGLVISTSVVSSEGIKNNSTYLYYLNDSGYENKIKMEFDNKLNKYTAIVPLKNTLRIIKFYFNAEDENGKRSDFPGKAFGKYFTADIISKKLLPIKRRNHLKKQ